MGTELKPIGGDFQPVKSCTGRPRQKRELAVAEASEPAGRNRLFPPKDDSLSGKTFSSSRPAKHSWQHIVAHVKLSGSWTRQISLFQKFQLARGQDLSTMLRFIYQSYILILDTWYFQREYGISAKTVVLGQKSIIWSKQPILRWRTSWIRSRKDWVAERGKLQDKIHLQTIFTQFRSLRTSLEVSSTPEELWWEPDGSRAS